MKYSTRLVWPCLIFLTAWLLAASAAAQNKATQPAEQDQPVRITSNQMEADDRQKVITFSGNVVATQKDLVITCDVMRIFYVPSEPKASPASSDTPDSAPRPASSSNGKPAATAKQSPSEPGEPAGDIERIVCEGNVKVTQGDRVAIGQKAVYFAKEKPRRIILTGEPRLWRNRDSLAGNRIIYFMDEDRSIVEGSASDRVNAVFYPQSGNLSQSQGDKK